MRCESANRLIVLGLLWFSPIPALAAATDQAREDLFLDSVDVRIIQMEVVVEDREGRRVMDLKPEEFLLEVDGSPVPMEYFDVIQSGQSAGTRPPDESSATSGGNSYLVFIDSYFNLARDRNQVLEGIVAELPHLGPRDRMAVINYDGRRVQVLSGWTDSRPQIRQALDTAMNSFAGGLGSSEQYSAKSLDGFADSTRSVQRVRRQEGLTELSAADLRAVRDYEYRLEKVVTAATSSLRGFAHAPGRKIMVLLSGRWPASVASFLFDGPFVGGDQGMQLYQPLFNTANLLGYTIYPVHGPRPTIGTGQMAQDAEMRWAAHGIADETGGVALTKKHRRAALGRITEDVRSYYSLGFTPKWDGDPIHHRVIVKVTRPGLRVRSRQHFEDLSRKQSVTFMIEGALLLGEMPASKPLKTRLGPPQKSGRRRITLPLEVSIPLDAITMLPRGTEHFANLELRVAVLDPDGDRNEIPVIPIELRGPQPKPGQRAVYSTELQLRKESHRLVVSIHDPVSGAILLSSQSIAGPGGD